MRFYEQRINDTSPIMNSYLAISFADKVNASTNSIFADNVGKPLPDQAKMYMTRLFYI